MSYTPLPPRPSLELLRKRAKRRLTDLRAASPEARLFDAQLQLAREHGFSSWRALKEQIDRVRREGRFRADGSPAHLPDETVINGWPDFTSERPLKVLVSGCLTGLPVGVEGKPYGEYPPIVRFLARPEVDAVTFCPEHFAFGTPRDCPDIHGGDGYDVLDATAPGFFQRPDKTGLTPWWKRPVRCCASPRRTRLDLRCCRTLALPADRRLSIGVLGKQGLRTRSAQACARRCSSATASLLSASATSRASTSSYANWILPDRPGRT